MRLLLDTHIAIWAVLGDSQLPDAITDLIADGRNDVAVSLVSLWEIAVKNNLGRLPRDPIGLSVTAARAEFQKASFKILPLEIGAVEQLERLPRVHGDPFDRLLVAIALSGTWRLVTHDDTLARYGDFVIVA